MNEIFTISLTDEQRVKMAAFAHVAWSQAKEEAHRMPTCTGPRTQMGRARMLWALLWPEDSSTVLASAASEVDDG